ncbi:Lipoprotein signal peptidase [Buchnera aphidicola (Eriosoma grossulariae)]
MKQDIIVNKKYILIFCIILILDIYTKYWILKNIKLYEHIYILPIFNILHVHNYGLAFNLFDYNHAIINELFMINALFLLIILFIKHQKKNNKKDNYYYIMIFSGGIANIISKLYYGFIIDFIDLHLYNYHFFIFNLADISILIGIIQITKFDIKSYMKNK